MEMATREEIDNYFVGSKSGKMSYYGNPNYLDLLDKDKYSSYKDVTLADLGFTREAVEFQLKGMVADLINPVTGEDYTDDDYTAIIKQAVAQTEKEFDIVIRPREVVDRKDYHRNEIQNYLYIRATARPILHVSNYQSYYGNQTILGMDDTWIKVNNRVGQIQIQPSIYMQAQTSLINPLLMVPGGMPLTMPWGSAIDSAPQMLGLTYVAGMLPRLPEDEGIARDYYAPDDLVAYVCKYAAIEILERFGRAILTPGIAGYGVSMDGISSNVNTTASAENSATSGEIRNLMEDMKHIKTGLLNYYGGQNLGFIA